MRIWPAILLGAIATASVAQPAKQPALPRDAVEGLSGLPTPRFVSLNTTRANMRTGPGERYPITWVYQRRGLPLKVVKEYGIWREVMDPDGAKGWLHRNMIGGQRTAMVRNGVQALRARPDDAARILWRVEPGAIGTLSDCRSNWCRVSIGSRSGYIRYEALWGVEPGENFD